MGLLQPERTLQKQYWQYVERLRVSGESGHLEDQQKTEWQKLDFNSDGIHNCTQFTQLVPVDDCLLISVALIAKAERRRQPNPEGDLQYPDEVRRQLANKESYYERKLGQVQCSM